MSEELDGLFETLENDLLSRYQYNLLLNYITNLQEENQKLVKVIDEARELINYYGITPEQNDNVILRHILKDLLKILNKLTELKGGDKDVEN